MPADLPDPQHFQVHTELEVRWSDMDALGHVNNACYFTYFESVRLTYLAKVAPGHDFRSNPIPILAHTACDFLSPVEHPATLILSCRTTKVGRTSLQMEHLARDKASGAVRARATAILVFFDFHTHEKAPVPDALRERVRELDGV